MKNTTGFPRTAKVISSDHSHVILQEKCKVLRKFEEGFECECKINHQGIFGPENNRGTSIVFLKPENLQTV